MTPSTSKCCEKCYGPYSTQGYEVDSPCGNPDCPCHTTHNQEEGVIVRDLTIDILPQYKVERLGTLQEAVEEIKEEWEARQEAGEKPFDQEESIVMTGADFTQKQRDAINLLVAQAIQEERERLAGFVEEIAEETDMRGYLIRPEAKGRLLNLIRTNTK